jgi:uncharacterized membrane protein HdeD (DUF308 family)
MALTNPRINRTALGIVLIAVGLFVLVDVALVARISVLVIGGAAIAGGAFQAVHSFWTKEWTGFLWRLLLGALYIAFGAALITRPGLGATFLLYALGLVMVASGVARAWMGIKERGGFLWMILSGLFGIAAGLVILTGWPISGIRAIAVLLGLDLVTHGVAWLSAAWRQPALAR